MSDKTVDVSFYAQVEPDWWGSGALKGARLVRASQRWPSAPIGGTVLVKLTLRLSESAFKPLRPPAVEVPDESIQVTLAVDPMDTES